MKFSAKKLEIFCFVEKDEGRPWM